MAVPLVYDGGRPMTALYRGNWDTDLASAKLLKVVDRDMPARPNALRRYACGIRPRPKVLHKMLVNDNKIDSIEVRLAS